ncbi:hypothetical protein C380_10885 [Acidovorax sp. KKS102]|uniref:hypothetical protein n=1 Tax=Acidovorax sp. KKS102 TaxID=358220 RepID=UPI00028A66DE|nr:hypothetical protein [Acidovorax sp. KKS102]AFU45878.1 hypothetical protein C380_10885 [Acidovorax sp. KKS102]
MGAFDNGFNFGMRAFHDALNAKRQAVQDERDAEEFARKKAGWDRADKLQRAEDVAFSEVEDLQRTGQAVGKNTSGFSNPSAQMLHGQGGQAAVDEAASYANVENRRFGLPATHTTSVPSEAGASPVPTVTMRQATELDRVGALERLAVARRDVGAMERLSGQRKAAQLDLDRKAEVDRLGKLNDDEFLGELKKYVNPNADVPAMLGYDPKSKRFTLVSDVPGVPTQTLSRAELMQGALGAWEMGKGDYAAGLQMLLNTGKAQRDLSSGDFDRSLKVASLNQKADNDAGQLRMQQQQLGISAGHLGIAREEAARKKLVFEQESKLPDPVKRSYAALEVQAKAMDSAMYKAMADGNWQPGSPGADKLLADRAAVSLRMNKLLDPYMPTAKQGGAASAADPLGIRAPASPSATGKAEPKPAPTTTMQQAVSPPPATSYSGGRPATLQSFFGSSSSGADRPAQEPLAEPKQEARSPQSLGDDFASPMARHALTLRVQEAAAGGAPLTEVETLRARQLKLL